MRYIPKHFQAYELLPNDLYALYGDDGLYLMDDRILLTLDSIRDFTKAPITVNNWKSGGPFRQRGYRNIIDPKTQFTAHRFGRGVDFDIYGVAADAFRNMVKTGSLNKTMAYITRMEEGIEWIHMDCMGLPRVEGQKIEFFTKE
jgi:hypothetical protein